jgi:hypothetical protein
LKMGKEENKGGGVGQKNGIHGSAAHICIIAHVFSHLMNIVFRLQINHV